MSGEYSGIPAESMMGPDEARHYYGLSERESTKATELDKNLEQDGLAKIDMPLGPSDFEALVASYETCLEEYRKPLEETYHAVDIRHGNDAGQVRKKARIDRATGLQLEDPKNYFHFSEPARNRWREQSWGWPRVLRRFLDDGQEVHDALIQAAKQPFEELEETHPNILEAYFPGSPHRRNSLTFLRLISYDVYTAGDVVGDVGKPHFDISGASIQAYADAPGFWGSKDQGGERVGLQLEPNEAQFFMGIGHKKLYGPNTRLQPLWHGINRIIPAGVSTVPKRHAAVLFIDAPFINCGITAVDTLPHLNNDHK